jgi:hypothetical protein
MRVARGKVYNIKRPSRKEVQNTTGKKPVKPPRRKNRGIYGNVGAPSFPINIDFVPEFRAELPAANGIVYDPIVCTCLVDSMPKIPKKTIKTKLKDLLSDYLADLLKFTKNKNC